jgi:hypothetical protein
MLPFFLVLFLFAVKGVHPSPLPSPKAADSFQTYEWHYVSQAWDTWDCVELVDCLVGHAMLGLQPLMWFHSARQLQLLHYVLRKHHRLDVYYGWIREPVPDTAEADADKGALLVVATQGKCLLPGPFEMLR